MAFERPALTQLRQRIANDFEFRISGADAHTPGTGYTELAQIIAGVAHGLYGNQQWIVAQRFITTADDDIVEAEAALRNIARIPAAFAQGQVTFTGNVGAGVGTEVVLQSAAGARFRTTAAGTLTGTLGNGALQLAIIAQEPGAAGNLAAGTKLTLVNPIAGVDTGALVTAPGLSGGADVEPISRVRERVLEHMQKPPMGGRDYDYVAWAKAASVDVTRAWVSPHENGIGSIVVRVVTENLADPIPTQTLLDQVAEYIDQHRPAGLRNLSVLAPVAAPLNLVFTTLSPNTLPVRAAIEAEVRDLIRREYEAGGTLLLSHLRESISRATDEEDFQITLNTNLTYTASQFPTWGTPTWPAL